MLEGQAIKTRPVAAVSEEDYNYLMSHPDHRIHKKSVVIPERQFQLPALEAESRILQTRHNELYPEVPNIYSRFGMV